ncbi:MAG: CoxG family protein [Ardenticatenaceae bacterium]
MKIEGKYTFKGPIEVVYDMLQDPDALAKAMPGTKELKLISEDVYEAEVGVKIGPIKGSYAGTVSVKDSVRPTHFRLIVEGKGAAGFLKGEGTIDLEEDGSDKTLIKYGGETQVGGRIAQVGQRLVQSVARKMISRGFKSLEKELKQRQTAA